MDKMTKKRHKFDNKRYKFFTVPIAKAGIAESNCTSWPLHNVPKNVFS